MTQRRGAFGFFMNQHEEVFSQHKRANIFYHKRHHRNSFFTNLGKKFWEIFVPPYQKKSKQKDETSSGFESEQKDVPSSGFDLLLRPPLRRLSSLTLSYDSPIYDSPERQQLQERCYVKSNRSPSIHQDIPVRRRHGSKTKRKTLHHNDHRHGDHPPNCNRSGRYIQPNFYTRSSRVNTRPYVADLRTEKYGQDTGRNQYLSQDKITPKERSALYGIKSDRSNYKGKHNTNRPRRKAGRRPENTRSDLVSVPPMSSCGGSLA